MAIAIVGGGIAGLAAAIALARIGREVTVLERAAEFSEAGAGLQLGPNGVRALQWLGVWEALEPLTVAPERLLILDGRTGRTITAIPFGSAFTARCGAPYRVAHRADLLNALLATARSLSPIELKPATEVARVNAPAELLRSCGRTVYAEAVVGADGINSAVRASLLGDGAPARAGHMLYRALIDRAAVPSVADAGAVSLWLCPNAHVVHYPVSGGSRFNIVAVCKYEGSHNDWGTPANPSDVLASFASAAPELKSIISAPGSWLKWPAADRAPAARWGQGAATLIGDAAHPALPYLAQGAVMALEDAVVLADCVAITSDPAQAFRAYEDIRRPRTARLTLASRRQGSIYHLGFPRSLARNAVLKHMPQAMFFRQLDWLYSWTPPTRRAATRQCA